MILFAQSSFFPFSLFLAMIVELIALISLPVGGFVLFLYHNYYNHVYKRFQVILKSHKLSNTPEVQDPVVLQLESGQIPSWLNGIMYRIGKSFTDQSSS